MSGVGIRIVVTTSVKPTEDVTDAAVGGFVHNRYEHWQVASVIVTVKVSYLVFVFQSSNVVFILSGRFTEGSASIRFKSALVSTVILNLLPYTDTVAHWAAHYGVKAVS